MRARDWRGNGNIPFPTKKRFYCVTGYQKRSDEDPKNAFDIEKHLRRRPAIVKPDEVFDYYEIDVADLPEDMET